MSSSASASWAESGGDGAVGAHLGEVAHPAQQAQRDTRRAAAAAGDLGDAVGRDRHLQQAGGAAHDLLHRRQLVEVEAVDRAEAGAQRRGHQRQPGRRADQREARQLQADVARARPLADDDVERKVLHRRVEHLFDRPAQPVHLVDEEDVALAQVGQDRGQIAGALDGRARA